MALTSGDSGGTKQSYGMSVIRSIAKPKVPNVASPVPSSGTPWAPKPVSQVNYAPVQQKAVNYNQPAYIGTYGQGGTANSGYGGGGGGGGFGIQNVPSDPGPAPQSKPVMSESDWLAGDGEYQTQLGQFDGALQDFLGRLATQRSDFTNDYNTAVTGLGRNRDQALLGVGEDFTSRGLANSGLFFDGQKKTKEAFQTQQNGLDTAKTRAEADFGNQESDKRKSTEQAKGNAKLASLGRMSMSQQF